VDTPTTQRTALTEGKRPKEDGCKSRKAKGELYIQISNACSITVNNEQD
jgi:hypothetical protein